MNLVVDISFGEDLVLDPHATRVAAGIDRLGDFRDRHVRELPSFAHPQAAESQRFLISTLRDSIRKRERLWLIPLQSEDAKTWREWLPGDLFHVLGPEQNYEGHLVTPVGIAPQSLVEALVDRSTKADLALLCNALRDVDGLLLSTRIYKKLLEAGVDLTPRTRIFRWLTNPRVLAYIVVFVYSALRALPVTFVKEFHGSLLALWTIDLATAFPYTWGMLTMVTAPRFKMRVVGLVVTVVTFMLPYLYFGFHGRGYPPHVLGIIALLILSTFALEAYKLWMDRRVHKALTWRRRPHRHGLLNQTPRRKRQLR